MPEPSEPASSFSPRMGAYCRQISEQYRCFPLPDGRLSGLDLCHVMVDLAVEPVQKGPPGLFTREPDLPTLARDLIADAGTRIGLLGPMGSGKSLFLRSLAFACAAASPALPEFPIPENWRANPPLPLLLDAAEPGSLSRPVDAALDTALKAGHGLVLIDNLDRLAHGDSASVTALLARYSASRWVVACRDRAAAEVLVPLGFRLYRLCPLDLKQADALIGRYYEESARVARLPLDITLQQQAHDLQAAIRASADLRALAASPLLLLVCVEGYRAGASLPRERSLIFRRALETVLQRCSITPQEESLPPLESAITWLQPVASALLRRSACEQGGGLSATVLTDAFAASGSLPHHSQPDMAALCAVWLKSGVLQRDEHGLYTFSNSSLQHYLAARALLSEGDVAGSIYRLRECAPWRGVIRLVAGQLGAEQRLDELQQLFSLLIETVPASRLEQQRQIILAAELLLELAPPHPFAALTSSLCQRLLAVFDEPVLPLSERIHAGLVLGHFGDARTDNLLPELMDVPAGPFLLGDDHGSYDDEGPAVWVEIDAFAIGRHPVTNREYARFLASNPNYPRPHYWHDPAFNNPSQPVVGVTWNDAWRYCQWLGEQLQAAGLLSAGQTVRLPHEAEWEKAASWEAARWAKRRYPWGDDWQAGYCNTADDRGDWMTTPIGCYPDGASPYGVHDMIGNVWEWTADEYCSYPGSSRSFYEPATYVLRGSSCHSLPSNARCTYRSRLPAHYWRYHLGFRIVIAKE